MFGHAHSTVSLSDDNWHYELGRLTRLDEIPFKPPLLGGNC